MKSLPLILIAMIVSVGSVWACGSQSDTKNCSSSNTGMGTTVFTSNQEAKALDIVETAIGAGSFSTLVTAVQAADLVETLKGKGPFTVFAPTDEAFSKVPAKALESLLKDKALLSSVLTYHVISGNVSSSDVLQMDGKKVKTVNGKELTIRVRDGNVYVNDARVTMTDIKASNGVIHVIDTVIMPPSNNAN
jgi:uncharacterized surface protein with fasciclin (FAS1) repeats